MFGYFFGIFPSSLLLVVYFAYWLLIDEIWNSIVTVLNFVAVMLTCSLLKHKFQVICTLLIFTFGYLEFEIWPAVVSSIVIGIVLLEIKHFFDIGQYVYYYFPFISYLISPDRYLWVWFSGCTISLIRIWKMPLIWILLAIGLMKVCKYIEHGGASRASEPGKLRNDKTRVSGDQKPLMSHNLYSTNHVSVNNYDTRNIDVLNQLILKLWDHIQFYISKKISNFQKPLYRSGPFIVKDIYCGTVPFKIESIKILDAGLNRKIEVDVDVSYRGDCSIQAEVLLFKGSFTNISVSARFRIVLENLCSEPPFVKELRIYFVKLSDIKYELHGIVEFLSTIGFRQKLRDQIISLLQSMPVMNVSI